MNAKKLTGVVGVITAWVLGYSLYQIIPEGKELTDGEVVGELDGPNLTPYSVKLHRYGDHQFLEGRVSPTLENNAKLQQAPNLDALIPTLAERQREQRKQSAVAGATTALASGHSEIGSTILMDSASINDETNLLYRDQANGRYSLLGGISSIGIKLIAPPSGNPLYLTNSTIRDLGKDEPPAWDALRSDDLGATWQYDKDVTLTYQKYVAFLSPKRAIALDNCDWITCLKYSSDSAKHWSEASLHKQVWQDADEFEEAFTEQALHSGDQLNYGWSLYPLDVDRAIGWSWRERFSKEGEIELIETRRFEVLLRDDAPPTLQVKRAVAPVPPSTIYTRQSEGLPVYGVLGNQIYVLDKVEKNWRRLAAIPDVRGSVTRVAEAWFGRDAWVVLVYADPWLSLTTLVDPTTTYFYTRDQGKTWRPFQLPADQYGLLGLDASGSGLLFDAERDGKTVIRRYSLD